MKNNYFTVPSTGQKIKCKPISARILRDLDAERANFPKRPTYTITYPGGEEEQAEHDETSIEETPEDRPKWEAWVKEYGEQAQAWQERWMKALVILGIAEEPVKDWELDYIYLGYELPEDERELKLWWVNNVLLPTDDDKTAFSETVTLISTIRKEDLEKIEESFPGLLRWYSSKELDRENERLDDEPEIP